MPRDATTDLRKTPKKGEDKWGAAIRDSKRGGLSWSSADAEDLLAAVVAVTEDGAALLLSKTSDGGALTLQVLSASGRHRLYPATQAELNEALRLVLDTASS